jgi:hypothetical protein
VMEEQLWMLLDGGLPEDESDQLLREACSNLEVNLQQRENAWKDVEIILSRRLADPLTDSSWSSTQEGLSVYLGPDAFFLLTWLSDETDIRLDHIESLASLRVFEFLRLAIAAFGSRIRSSLVLFNNLPDDWEGLGLNAYFDHLTGLLRFKATVTKYSGDVFILEGPPDAFLALTHGLLTLLRGPDDAFIFEPRQRAQFIEEADEFMQFLRRERLETAVQAHSVEQ